MRNFSPWAYWSLRSRHLRDDDLLAREGWRDEIRRRLTELLGATPAPVPLDVEVTETVDCGDHVRSRIVFDTEAAMSVPAYLLVPAGLARPGPAVLAVHGHGPGKAAVCGVEAGAGASATHDDYARQLVRLGHVVLAPDLRCFGERQDPQWDPASHKYDCDWNLVAAAMAGVNPIAQNLWDLRRSLDVLAEHPLVDPERLAAAGFSYGATMVLFLAALDERVRAAIVSGYVSSWRAAHAVPWNMCGSQIMFGQLGRLEHVDVAALIAPRGLLVESGLTDPIFPVAAASATVERLRPIWAEAGAATSLVHDVFAGGHEWHGAGVAEFLRRHLGP